jgi:CBS domain containing-hemolysin-like protein
MNTPLLILDCAVLGVLFGLSAFFAGSETALFALTPVQVQRIRDRNPRAGARLQRMLSQPERVLSTTLIGNTIANVAIASVSFVVVHMLAPQHSTLIAIPTTTVLLLLFGDLVPMRIAIAHSERLAPALSAILVLWMRLFAPLGRLLETSSRLLRRFFLPERMALNDAELLTMMQVGAEQGVLDAEERSMVDGIMRLSELKASDAMTPRVDLIGIDLDDPPDRQLAVARQARFLHLPVYRRTPDATEGFLNAARYLLDPAHDIRKATTPALFVPENVTLDDLLITFQRNDREIACVLDEYGGTAGVVTRGDVLEFVVKGVERERVARRPLLEELGGSTWMVEGTAVLDEVNHTLGTRLEAEGADRIAGWVAFHAGRLLKAGECVEAQGCRATVRRLRNHRIEQVQLERLPPAGEPQAAPANRDREVFE